MSKGKRKKRKHRLTPKYYKDMFKQREKVFQGVGKRYGDNCFEGFVTGRSKRELQKEAESHNMVLIGRPFRYNMPKKFHAET